jgi:hypothetical protein
LEGVQQIGRELSEVRFLLWFEKSSRINILLSQIYLPNLRQCDVDAIGFAIKIISKAVLGWPLVFNTVGFYYFSWKG